MGISFDGIFNAAKSALTSAASMENKTDRIDSKSEKDAVKNIFIGLNKSAASQVVANTDVVEFNKGVEQFKNLVAQEKSAAVPFADDAETYADLMQALSEVDPSLDMGKVNKYATKPNKVKENLADMETITTSKDGYVGMDQESYNTVAEALGKDANKVFKHMAKAIKSGSGSRITNDVVAFNNDNESARTILDEIDNIDKNKNYDMV